MTIDGRHVVGTEWFEVVNPATLEVVGRAPDCTPELLDLAMVGAQEAWRLWRADDGLRAEALRRCADALEASLGDLAATLTAEQGKPRAEAAEEIAAGVSWLRHFGELDVPPHVVQDDERGYVEVLNQSLGVVAAITPWNFPVSLAIWKIAPALRAGNTMVLKPSPLTPLTTLLLGHLLAQELPPGVLNVVTGRDPLGALLTSHPVPRKLTFTGSTATGKQVMAAAAVSLKRVTLELGGNDPALVLPDADPARIARRLFWGAFLNNGQVCMAAKRVYVHESIHDDLVAALVAEAEGATVGDGAEEGTRLGPVNNSVQRQRVDGLVAAAIAQGAVVATGGSALQREGWFYRPTILVGATDEMRVVAEEQFGPVLPVVRYTELVDAVRAANSGEFGLTASVWSRDIDQASEIALTLDVGSVSVNRHGGAVGPHLPFAGHRSSGLGVENGIWGLRTYTETQAFARPARKPSLNVAD